MLVEIPKTPLEELKTPFLEFQKIRIFIKRDDLNDPLLMGNKFRKLKYNLITARAKGADTLLTITSLPLPPLGSAMDSKPSV
jgi:1-aminocyclopropane-1-carboxylate deaminase